MAELFNITGSYGYKLEDLQSLSKSSSWPDWDFEQNDNLLYYGHFYDPDTGENYVHQTNNTARTRAEKYYNFALSSYKKDNVGDRVDAIAYLAYCLHYIQDAGEPHHAANLRVYITDDANNHAGFEQLASQILLNENLADEIDWEHDSEFYSARLTQSIGDFVHEIASFSKPLANLASNKENITGQRLAATLTLTATIQNTAGVLCKFAKDAKMI